MENDTLMSPKVKNKLTGVVLLLSFLAFFVFVGQAARGSISVEEAATGVIDMCAGAPHRPSCYEREVPLLGLSLEESFAVTQLVQVRDSSYQYCHVLGHELAAQEVQKNPSNWKEVVQRCPTQICSNGCIHGAFQERFRSDVLAPAELEKITPDLMNVCESRSEWKPTGITQASCYHALGHLMMYITGGETNQSIDLCTVLAVKGDGRDYSQLCFDGVFMQTFQPLEPEDFALVAGKQPTRDTVPSFCGVFSGKIQASCLSESWPLFREEIYTPEGVVRFCTMTEALHRERCYDAVFYVVTAMFNLDGEKMSAYCSALQGGARRQCFADVATRMIEVDERNIGKAVSFCAVAEKMGEGSACYGGLIQLSTFVFKGGSPAFFALCGSLPKLWQEACLSRSK